MQLQPTFRILTSFRIDPRTCRARERDTLEAEAEAIRVTAAADVNAAKETCDLERARVERESERAMVAASTEVEAAKEEASLKTRMFEDAHLAAAAAVEAGSRPQCYPSWHFKPSESIPPELSIPLAYSKDTQVPAVCTDVSS